MITVPEAARRLQRNPETIRRWIRSGRLRSERVGTQHVIDERDLERFIVPTTSRLPGPWRHLADGAPMPDVVAWLRRSRAGH